MILMRSRDAISVPAFNGEQLLLATTPLLALHTPDAPRICPQLSPPGHLSESALSPCLHHHDRSLRGGGRVLPSLLLTGLSLSELILPDTITPFMLQDSVEYPLLLSESSVGVGGGAGGPGFRERKREWGGVFEDWWRAGRE